MTDPIGFGVIGCGLMGQRHAEILRSTPECRLVAVYDQDRTQAEKAARGVEVLASYEEMLARSDVDAVVVALPSYLHVEYGVRAARAGKHVVTEKPISIDVESGKELIGACQAHHVVCAVISQNRFSDGNAALYRALRQNVLGIPALVRGSVKWFRHDDYYTRSSWRGRREGEGGGVLMNQATHTLDLLLWFFGFPQTIVGLTSTTRPVLETEDVGVALFRFSDGTLGTFEATTSAFPGFEERVEVHGAKGSCVVEKGKMIYWKHADDLPAPEPPPFAPASEGLDPRYVLFQRQYRNIVAAIRGEAELVVKPEEALAVVEATQAIYTNQPT